MDIVKGHTFVSGEVVEAQSLNDLVGNAVIQPTLISEKVLKDPAAMSDKILIEDSGTLKGITIQQIIDLIAPQITNSAVPVGTVCAFAGPNAPANWMLCYGQLIDRDVYSDLFAILGSVYSAGDGTTTFGLPDYRGCVLAAKNNMGGTSNGLLSVIMGGSALNAFGGEERHTLSINEMPVHGHPLNVNMYTTTQEGGTNYGLVNGGPFNGRVFVTSPSVYVAPASQGGSQPHSNVQPTKIVNMIIKVLAL